MSPVKTVLINNLVSYKRAIISSIHQHFGLQYFKRLNFNQNYILRIIFRIIRGYNTASILFSAVAIEILLTAPLGNESLLTGIND